MKELFIVRHGKSSWNIDGLSDMDRPLKERGIHDGYTMAKRIMQKSKKPDLIISSPAIRALHSATIFARVLEYPYGNILITEELYFSGVQQVLELLKSIQDNVNTLMIFGHNPTFTDLANVFTGNKIDNLPTTGVVHVQTESNTWSEFNKSTILNQDFDYPKKTE